MHECDILSIACGCLPGKKRFSSKQTGKKMLKEQELSHPTQKTDHPKGQVHITSMPGQGIR